MRNCTPPRLLLWIRFCNYSNVKLSARLADSLSLAAIFYTFFLNLDFPIRKRQQFCVLSCHVQDPRIERIIPVLPVKSEHEGKKRLPVIFTFTSTNLIQGLLNLLRPRFYEENLSQEEGSPSLALSQI